MNNNRYWRELLSFLILCSTVVASENADNAFAVKDYRLARDLYVRDRETYYEKQQNQNWKEATLKIVRCSTALGDSERAVQEYFLLIRKDAAPPLEFLPLPWFVPLNRIVGVRPHEQTAENYLNENINMNPVGKLLAATVLSVCADNAKRLRGTAVLRELTAVPVVENDDYQKQVFLTAAAFLWKQRLVGLHQPAELKPLRKILESLPQRQRAGVYFLLAEGAAQVNESEAAVLYWMRIPILYPEDKLLVTESLRRAAEMLEKQGRTEQADKLRDELDSRNTVKNLAPREL